MANKNQEIIFVFEGRRYLVRDIHFKYSQQVDSSGRPSTIPRHSNIYLVIVPMGKAKDKDILLHFATKRMFRGHIEFLRVENGLENKICSDLEFANARFERCGFSTKFEDCEGESLMRVVIKPLIVRHQGAITELPRNPSNPFIERNTPVTEREVEEDKKVTSIAITDEKGNEKPKYKIGDTIYAHVKSIGKVGDTIDFQIADKTKDFKYQGKILPNDTISNYQIQSNSDKIALEVVTQQKKES